MCGEVVNRVIRVSSATCSDTHTHTNTHTHNLPFQINILLCPKQALMLECVGLPAYVRTCVRTRAHACLCVSGMVNAHTRTSLRIRLRLRSLPSALPVTAPAAAWAAPVPLAPPCGVSLSLAGLGFSG